MTRGDNDLCSFFRHCASFNKECNKGSMLEDCASPKHEKLCIPQYKSVSRRNCLLLNFIWERNWPKAVQRIQTHPSEAFCITESTGRTALHLASFNHGCPLRVAEALLEANLHALWMTDSSNLTPLHYACTFKGGTDHLIPLFCCKLDEMDEIFEGPQPNLGSNNGPSPLLLACRRNAPVAVLRTLVSSIDGTTVNKWIAPETGGEPYWYNRGYPGSANLSPLSALLKQLAIEKASDEDKQVFRDWLISPSSSRSRQLLPEGKGEDTIEDDVEKMMLLIKHGFKGYSGSVLHMVCALKIPMPTLVSIVGTAMPEQAICRDSLGCTPLHHIISHPFATFQQVKSILAVNDQACKVQSLEDNAYPLILAIRNGWEWDNGVAELVRAHPEPLDVADSSIGLVPFLLAASRDAEVATIFELLRASPHVLCSTQDHCF